MHIFVTGTDTDVGKTTISSWLCLHTGYSYFKPIQTGGSQGTDSNQVSSLTETKVHEETFIFEKPVSPHLAASLENGRIEIDKICLPKTDNIIIEGAGGVLVPINETILMVDLIKKLDVPTILVARSTLGTINHTLLSLEALSSRNITVLGVILNGPLNPDNQAAIEFYGKTKVLASVPALKQVDRQTLIQLPFTNQLRTIFGLTNMSLAERDQAIIWHPFTQEKLAALPILIKRGQGSYLYDDDDKQYLDLISSWWVNLYGHAHPEIAKAIFHQSMKLEHVIFAGFTHEPAVTLCEKLSTLLPNKLSRFFFSDNGSTAVEVALKMAHQYWWNQGNNERTIFLSFEGGYHGDTFGAMSVGVKSGFHSAFENLFFTVLTLPFPETWDNDDMIENKEKQSLKALEDHLDTSSQKIAAMILEPLVQGASGMRMCRPTFVKKVLRLVREHGILIIFDEVMTGFGRTGTYFALEQIHETPDFICLSKGLTGGFLPLSLTVTTQEIYSAFLGEHFTKAFAHGHSYTANPIGCAAAIASFDILVRKDTMDSIKMINKVHREELTKLSKSFKHIQHTRIQGTIAAFDVPDAQKLKSKFLGQGLLIRPLGNTVYLLPPYSTSITDLEMAYGKISHILKSTEIRENGEAS